MASKMGHLACVCVVHVGDKATVVKGVGSNLALLIGFLVSSGGESRRVVLVTAPIKREMHKTVSGGG